MHTFAIRIVWLDKKIIDICSSSWSSNKYLFQLQFAVRLASTTISEFKATIEEKTTIPVAWQHIMFHGEVLDDAWRLSLGLRGIHEGCTLDLVVSSAEVPS